MNQQDTNALSGTIFDEDTDITVVELCELCCIDRPTVEQLIAEGILEPRYGKDSSDAQLPYSSVRITSIVVRLQRDLGVNLAGAALAIDLLQHIDELRAQLRQRG
jgi:chaperone modulatory protein CbpM